MNRSSKKQYTQSSRGFTLIELMLAMTFISMLLLAIALTIVQIATIYNRGVTAKDINEISRDISTELNLALTSSTSFSLNAGANHYVHTTDGGRLCVGDYSYIWNYANALSPASSSISYPNPTPDPARNQYVTSATPNLSANVVNIPGHATRYEISLVKAPDAGGSYCIKGASGYPNIKTAGATELLRTGDYGIQLYDLEITSPASASDALSGQQLYTITYVLGTPDTNAMTAPTGQPFCIAPGLPHADTDYCSVQVFTLVVRVVNGVN